MLMEILYPRRRAKTVRRTTHSAFQRPGTGILQPARTLIKTVSRVPSKHAIILRPSVSGYDAGLVNLKILIPSARLSRTSYAAVLDQYQHRNNSKLCRIHQSVEIFSLSSANEGFCFQSSISCLIIDKFSYNKLLDSHMMDHIHCCKLDILCRSVTHNGAQRPIGNAEQPFTKQRSDLGSQNRRVSGSIPVKGSVRDGSLHTRPSRHDQAPAQGQAP